MIKINEVKAKHLCLGEEDVGGTESREAVVWGRLHPLDTYVTEKANMFKIS